MKRILIYSLFILLVSCTFSGRSEKNDSIANFITGSADVNKIKDVHVINLVRAIGAPNNFTTIGKYKYYQWSHSRTVGVSTLFGGGSTTLYCTLTAETRSDKVKLINWYGNKCGIFLDPIGDYFKDKLNIAVISDEEDKKQNVVTPVKSNIGEGEKKEAEKEINQDAPQNTIDLRPKTSEQENSAVPNRDANNSKSQ